MKRIKCGLSDFGFSSMTPAPRVQAHCYLPELGAGRAVDFMIDTGASSTCINGYYAWGLRKYTKNSQLTPSTGIGGVCGYYKEPCVLVFLDDTGHKIPFELILGIQKIKHFLW